MLSHLVVIAAGASQTLHDSLVPSESQMLQTGTFCTLSEVERLPLSKVISQHWLYACEESAIHTNTGLLSCNMIIMLKHTVIE